MATTTGPAAIQKPNGERNSRLAGGGVVRRFGLCSLRRFFDLDDLIGADTFQFLNNARRPTNLHGFSDMIPSQPEVDRPGAGRGVACSKGNMIVLRSVPRNHFDPGPDCIAVAFRPLEL